MRVWLSGGGGFVGGAVARLLRGRGDEVVAVVRDPSRATALAAIGAEPVAGDLASTEALAAGMRGVDAVVHAAGSYRIGIPPTERAAMWDANVGTTTRVLDAATAAGVPRIAYVSTVNVFGNTRGRLVDESYVRDLRDGFLSWYDETKFRAHEAALERIAAGAPIVVAMPGQVYGPGDHSSVGEQLRLAGSGKLPYRAVEDVGVCLVHVDDLAAGIAAVVDRGRIGQAYVLAGPPIRLGEAIALAARLHGRRPPRLRIPTTALRVLAPLGRIIGQPNLRELISSSAGVTYWASAGKAALELGFAPRPIEAGFRDTFGPG